MPHGLTKIPSRGVCIYCKQSDIKLTDEHIVPFSLGGRHILLEASCLSCADITKKFEQDISRSLWGDARASYNAPTRRKKERKHTILLRDPKAQASDLEVPMNEYPALMIFYHMNRAGILQGEAADIDNSGKWKLISIVDEKRLQNFVSKHPNRLTGRFKHVPDSFARLLVKIAYGQILTSLAPEDFNPFCIPYILGQKTNLSYIVGSRAELEKPLPGIGYSLKSCQFGTTDRAILAAEVRLFADNHTPTYHIVVGDVIGKEKIKIVQQKLDAFCTVEMPERFEFPREPPDELHWMPRLWPLPFWEGI